MIRGWCPTVHAPMPSGDGLLVRVKPFGGRLSSPALHALADAVAAFGNGAVELTSRGNLQVRGVKDAPEFARAMVAAGLADPDPAREARRNVIAIPPCDDTMVARAEAWLAATPGLPPKFCVVVMGAQLFLDGEPVVALSPAGKGRFTLPLGHDQGERMGHLLHPPFGQTDLGALASLGVEIRTTPWRAFLSPLACPGFSPVPATITACPGAPACASASVPARLDAARLAEAGLAGIHVSGCAKGCGQPGAPTTLVGREGQYDLVRTDRPTLHGLTLDQAMAAL
jgi:precorrin-3B synthase